MGVTCGGGTITECLFSGWCLQCVPWCGVAHSALWVGSSMDDAARTADCCCLCHTGSTRGGSHGTALNHVEQAVQLSSAVVMYCLGRVAVFVLLPWRGGPYSQGPLPVSVRLGFTWYGVPSGWAVLLLVPTPFFAPTRFCAVSQPLRVAQGLLKSQLSLCDTRSDSPSVPAASMCCRCKVCCCECHTSAVTVSAQCVRVCVCPWCVCWQVLGQERRVL